MSDLPSQIRVVLADDHTLVRAGMRALLEKMPNKNFKIIFTTAYNEYAIQAIRFSAFDYLLKPVDIEELQASVHRFLESKRRP